MLKEIRFEYYDILEGGGLVPVEIGAVRSGMLRAA